MFKKFTKQKFRSVFQLVVLLGAMAVVVSLAFPNVRFFLTSWFVNMGDGVFNNIGTHGKPYKPATPPPGSPGAPTGPVLLAGDKTYLLKPPTLSVTPVRSDGSPYPLGSELAFGAKSEGAIDNYTPVPPFYCTWSGGYTAVGCDIDTNQRMAVAAGTHDIVVEMCDSNGTCGTNTIQVQISSYPVVKANILINPAKTIYYVTDLVKFSADVSGGTGTGYNLTWYRGDIIDPSIPNAQSYPRGEPTTVKVKACDQQLVNYCSESSYKITVQNRPPTAPTNIAITYPSGRNPSNNDAVTIAATGATDPDGDAIAYVWEGLQTTYTVGQHTVRARADDRNGGLSDWVSFTFTVDPAPPILIPNIDLNGTVYSNQPVYFTPSSNDSGLSFEMLECTSQCNTQNPVLIDLPVDNKYGPGVHTIAARSKDSTGRYSSWTFYTFTVNFKVLEVFGYTEELRALLNQYGMGKISLDAMSIQAFNSGTTSVWDYDMVVFGFADCYSGCGQGGSFDLNDRRYSDILAFGSAGRGVLLSHDVPALPNFRKLMVEQIGSDPAKPSLSWSGNTTVYKSKDGSMTQYPYALGSTIPIAPTHGQSVGYPDVSKVWFTIDANNVAPGWYIISNNNWVYTTTGHAVGGPPDRGVRLTNAPVQEQQLLVNTVFYTSQFRERNMGLFASYNFNGSANDASGNGNHGAFMNVAPSDGGVEGQSVALNGVNQYVRVPTASSLAPRYALTMEAWVNPTDATGEKQIMNKENTYEMALHSGKLAVAIYSANSPQGYWTWEETNVVVPLNTWSHVASTYDGRTIRFYLNGAKVWETSTREAGPIQSPTPNYPLLIGARSCCPDQNAPLSPFKGKIDGVRLYKIPLSDSQIMDDYTQYMDKVKHIDPISNYYWEMRTYTTASGGNEYAYTTINTDAFAIPAGAYLQYDVWEDEKNKTFQGAVEIDFTDGATMRDFGVTSNPATSKYLSRDNFDIPAHPHSDLSGIAKGQWYRRNISLEGLQGKTISHVSLAQESDVTGTNIFRVANIRIYAGGAVVKDIFPGSSMSHTNSAGITAGTKLQYANYITQSLDKNKTAILDFSNGQMQDLLNIKSYSLNGATVVPAKVGNGLQANNGQRPSVPIMDLGVDDAQYVTVSFWYKYNNDPIPMPVAFKQFDYWCNPSNCGINTGGGDKYGIPNPYSTSAFRHTVVVFKKGDRDGGSIYIDGVKQDLSLREGTTPINSAATFEDSFNIGGWKADNNYSMAGSVIDEVNIWNRALTDDEVRTLYYSYPSVPVSITDKTIVSQNYSTSGNGGRKLIRLGNGWLVSGAYDPSGSLLRFYISKDNGNTWTDLFYTNQAQPSGTNFAMEAFGTNILVATNSLSMNASFFKIDASLVGNTNQTPFSTIDSSQSMYGNGISLAKDASGGLHAAYASKSSSNPGYFNIRYAKSADGGATWTTTQLTTDAAKTNYTNPSIAIVSGNPVVVFQGSSSSGYAISGIRHNGTAWQPVSNIFVGGFYPQSSPATVVDQSGVVHLAWDGSDSAQASRNIRYSKSSDGGATWTPASKITSNAADQQEPSITADSNGGIHIVWSGFDSSFSATNQQLIKSVFANGNWSSPQRLTSVNQRLSGVSALTSFNVFSDPVAVYNDSIAVKFRGTFSP